MGNGERHGHGLVMNGVSRKETSKDLVHVENGRSGTEGGGLFPLVAERFRPTVVADDG